MEAGHLLMETGDLRGNIFLVNYLSPQTGELPVRVFSVAGVSVANVVYLTGGEEYDQATGDTQPQQGIYRFDGGGGGSWILVGNMTTSRYYHAATPVLRSHYDQYCL